jgi:hypothetical protein
MSHASQHGCVQHHIILGTAAMIAPATAYLTAQ